MGWPVTSRHPASVRPRAAGRAHLEPEGQRGGRHRRRRRPRRGGGSRRPGPPGGPVASGPAARPPPRGPLPPLGVQALAGAHVARGHGRHRRHPSGPGPGPGTDLPLAPWSWRRRIMVVGTVAGLRLLLVDLHLSTRPPEAPGRGRRRAVAGRRPRRPRRRGRRPERAARWRVQEALLAAGLRDAWLASGGDPAGGLHQLARLGARDHPAADEADRLRVGVDRDRRRRGVATRSATRGSGRSPACRTTCR